MSDWRADRGGSAENDFQLSILGENWPAWPVLDNAARPRAIGLVMTQSQKHSRRHFILISIPRSFSRF